MLVLGSASPSLHAQSKHVLIIGLDGVRTDCLKQAHTPSIDGLVAQGAVSWDAFAGGAFAASDPTHQATSSGPGWTSILTGVWVDQHGVSDNGFGGNDLVNHPHLFAHVRAAQPAAYLSSIVHWDPINDQLLAPFPGLADFTQELNSDKSVSTAAASHLGSADPDVLFLHFDDCDGVGHGSGFNPTNPAYIDVIEQTDEYIGDVLAAVEARPGYASEEWLVLVTTDHGGNLTSHGGHAPGERAIWIVAQGPGVAAGTYSPGPGHTAVARTSLHHLGVPHPPGFADQHPFGFARPAASYPVPPDGEQNQPADAGLSWAAGQDAVAHEVYLGTSPLLGPAQLQGSVSQPGFSPAALEPETTYYWRVDTTTSSGSVTGPLWSFRTSGSILDQLVLHLDFEGDLEDASLNGTDGTPSGNPSEVAGLEGNALELDGSGDFISLGSAAQLQFGAISDFSVSLWLRSDGWSGDPVFLGNKNWISGSNQGWLLAGETDGKSWQWNYKGAGGSRLDYDFAGVVADGGWHHIAVTHDRDGMVSFYQDGELLTAGWISGLGNINTGLATALGQDGTLNYPDDLAAELDEVRVWRRCLGAAEVAALYGAGPDAVWKPLVGASQGTHGPPQLVGVGAATPGSATSLELGSGLENSVAYYVIGFAPQNLPFKGGLLVPEPDLLLPLPTDVLGSASFSFLWPPGFPTGMQAWAQAWVLDPAGSGGVAASNAVSVTTP